MPETLSPLPRYDYVGPYAKRPEVVAGVDNYLRSTQPAIEAHEIYTPEYEAQFLALGSAVWELGSDLGLDLEDRLRSLDYVHLYDPTGYSAVRDQYGLPEGSVAVHSTSGHMMALEGHSSLATLANVNHELVHVISRKSIRPGIVENEGGSTITSDRSHDGYASFRHGTFNGLNEVLTEATNIDLIRNYWPRHHELATAAQEHYENVGYLPELILFDELLKAHFENPKAVFKDLQKGMITGDMGVLRSLTDAIGADVMREVASNLNDNDPEKAVALAEQLGLNDAVRKIKANTTDDLLVWL